MGDSMRGCQACKQEGVREKECKDVLGTWTITTLGK